MKPGDRKLTGSVAYRLHQRRSRTRRRWLWENWGGGQRASESSGISNISSLQLFLNRGPPSWAGTTGVSLRLRTSRALGKDRQVQKEFGSPEEVESRIGHQETMSESAWWWNKGLRRELRNPRLAGEVHLTQAGLRESERGWPQSWSYCKMRTVVTEEEGVSCELEMISWNILVFLTPCPY